MNENLELKSISEILDKHFFIPSYQRGYRWDERQVLDLVDDMDEFAHKIKTQNEFYCLQPIVIRWDEKHYKVIDGQQRLTTIYIILKYLEESSVQFETIKEKLQNNDEVKNIFEFCNIESFEIKKPYSLEYETRKDGSYNSKDFLENKLSKGIDHSNPDYYYMSKAYQTIKKWFKNKNKKLFLDTLTKSTKVIWYEVNCQHDKEEIEIFTRLNIGKIQLTNAELIKAMLLLPIKDYKEQIEFSTVWDKIEQTLQNNNFWYFLSNSLKSETAIDLIFQVLAQKYQEKFNKANSNDKKLKFKPTDNKYAYYIFAHILKNNFKTEDEIWQEAQELYRTFLNWNNDREIYHKVAYLIHFKYTLLELYQAYENKTKDNFKYHLEELMKKDIKNINLMTLNYGGQGIHRTLLLFNIETILKNKNSNARFDFFHFKFIEKDNGEVQKRGWDIEHIASQTDNTNQEEWVKAILKYVYGINIAKHKEKIKNIAKDKFDLFYNRTKRELNIKEPSENNKDNIGNLTLLDSKTNRSYGNAFFPIKRAIIIEEDSSGNFIPICTKNIFLKQYSSKLSNMMNWTDEDIENHRDEIFRTLMKYNIDYYCEIGS